MPAMPVVYIDVVWFINLVMDAMLLWTTGWLLKRKTRFWRIVLGGFIGAGYSLILFFPTLSLLTTWPGKAIMSVVMVYLALPKKNMLDLARVILVFYFVSFVFAGASIALGFAVPGVSLGKSLAISGHGLMFATSGETLALMVAIPLVIFGLQRIVHRLSRISKQGQWLRDVEATFGDVTIRFPGLLDSGNQLYDPVSHRPVSFVDQELLHPVLPEEVKEILDTGGDLLYAVAQVSSTTSFTLVPFQGASGRGLTIALRPDRVVLWHKNEEVVVTQPQLFGVYPGQLSSDGGFRAILHMDMMIGDEDVESNADTERLKHETTNSTSVAFHTHQGETPR